MKPVLGDTEVWLLLRRECDDPEYSVGSLGPAFYPEYMRQVARELEGREDNLVCRAMRFIPGEPHTPTDGLMSAWDILEYLAKLAHWAEDSERASVAFRTRSGTTASMSLDLNVLRRAAEIVGRK